VFVALSIGVAVGLLLRFWVVYPLRVVSNSMSPTLEIGDMLVVRELGLEEIIQRGDMVVYRFPPATDGRAVKRVVALPGDTVTVEAAGYEAGGIAASSSAPDAATQTTTVLPAGSVFILGDNVTASVDSRMHGPLPRSEIVGRVIWTIRVPWR